jgi:hypothetical protein
MRDLVLMMDGLELEPLFAQNNISPCTASAYLAIVCHRVFILPVEPLFWKEIGCQINHAQVNPFFYRQLERFVRTYQELSMYSYCNTPDLSLKRVENYGSDYRIVLARGSHP